MLPPSKNHDPVTACKRVTEARSLSLGPEGLELTPAGFRRRHGVARRGTAAAVTQRHTMNHSGPLIPQAMRSAESGDITNEAWHNHIKL